MERDGPNVSHQHSHEDGGYRRIELITGRRRRRDWTPEEKAEILAASMEPGRTVVETARRYQVSRGLLWEWRRKARVAHAAPKAGTCFIPLQMEADPAANPLSLSDTATSSSIFAPTGSIEIEAGRTRVRVQGLVDPEALRQVLAQVLALVGAAR